MPHQYSKTFNPLKGEAEDKWPPVGSGLVCILSHGPMRLEVSRHFKTFSYFPSLQITPAKAVPTLFLQLLRAGKSHLPQVSMSGDRKPHEFRAGGVFAWFDSVPEPPPPLATLSHLSPLLLEVNNLIPLGLACFYVAVIIPLAKTTVYHILQVTVDYGGKQGRILQVGM